MNDKICHILMPQYCPVDLKDTEGCIKPHGHFDAHSFIMQDGSICEWEFDHGCECGCNDEDGDGGTCITYQIIKP